MFPFFPLLNLHCCTLDYTAGVYTINTAVESTVGVDVRIQSCKFQCLFFPPNDIDQFGWYIKQIMNVLQSCNGENFFLRWKMEQSIQLSFASVNGTLHPSTHKIILTIVLINIRYLYISEMASTFNTVMYLENLWVSTGSRCLMSALPEKMPSR